MGGNPEAAAEDIRVIRRVEPENREAKQRLVTLKAAMAPQPEPVSSTAPAIVSAGGPGDEAGGGLKSPSTADGIQSKTADHAPSQEATLLEKQRKKATDDDTTLLDDEEEEVFDHAATASLLGSAADYMKRNDYQGALQIYNYVRRRCKDWESPLIELKVLSNTSLCLQRLSRRVAKLSREYLKLERRLRMLCPRTLC